MTARNPHASRLSPASAFREERGIALVTALIMMSVILFLGTFALLSSRSEIRTSANYRGRVQAQYFAEAGIDQVAGYQNDLTKVPRYLFDPANYVSASADSAVFNDMDAMDPQSGKKIGSVHRVIVGSNPASSPPPYHMRSTATLADGSQAIYEVDLNALSLLDFAMYAEASLGYCPPGMTLGRTYSAGNIFISGGCTDPETFMKRVEFAGSISGTSHGDFREGYYKVPAYPPLTTLVDLAFYENAATGAGVCDEGKGLLISYKSGLPPSVQTLSKDLFRMQDNVSPGVQDLDMAGGDWDANDKAVTGCMLNGGGNGCYQIDLTLFDFAKDTVTYGGVPLRAANGAWLMSSDFNGVVFVDGELHVWGILGGRSTEDATTTDKITPYDTTSLRRIERYDPGDINPPKQKIQGAAVGRPFYHHPNFTKLRAPWNALTSNLYSNNALDAGEDANANGILDPAKRGRSLTIVTADTSDIVIDHNIFYGQDPKGNRVTLGLIAGDAVNIDASSPRALSATGAKLGRGSDSYGGWNGSFVALPNNDQDTHRLNLWAKARGDVNPADSTYAFDLNGNGQIEADNGMGLAGDRNETSMRSAWSALDLGNVVTRGGASYGAWATGFHGGTLIYDFGMLAAEPPCWPVLPFYGTVPGSFTEVRN